MCEKIILPEVNPRQRGFLLIAAVFMIVTVALLATVIVFLTAGNVLSGAQHANSAKALFVAESGLERGIYGYKNGTWCTSLGTLTPPSTVGDGDFSLTGTFYIVSSALSANITAAATTVPVTSTAGFTSHGRIRIENEDMDYAAISGNSFTGVRRGVAGSTAAAHNVGAGVNAAQDQCVIRSTGVVTTGNSKRVTEKGIQNPGAMIVYSKNGPAADRDIPFFRRWDGTNWGPEQQATTAGGDQRIRYMVLKFARTRNEAVLGTLQENGDIEVQVWNGNTQTWSGITSLVNIGAANSLYRGFDIEYETISDRAIVVFNDGTADPNYRIWDGSNWSLPATNIDILTTGDPIWIELAPHPTSNEMVMITLDENHDIYGMRWPGGGAPGALWDDMLAGVGPPVWDTTTAIDDANVPNMNDFTKIIDVAYEQTTGEAMFIWGDDDQGAGNQRLRYRSWTGAALTAINSLAINTMGGVANWIRLVPNPTPGSNQLMVGVQDNARDLNTVLWSGAAWAAAVVHDTDTEDVDQRNFDIVFETNPINQGQAWLMWGSRFGADVTRRCLWNGAAWCGAPTNFGDDGALVQLAVNPTTGVIFASVYQDSGATPDDITALSFTAGAWSGESVIWGGPTAGDPVNERVYIAPEHYSQAVDWREIFP